MTLWQVAAELSRRLTSIFGRDADGLRPANRNLPGRLLDDPYWRDLLLFYEYFHGDSGAGVGANHQTGWSGLVTKLVQQGVLSSSAQEKLNSRGSLLRQRLANVLCPSINSVFMPSSFFMSSGLRLSFSMSSFFILSFLAFFIS
jgi:hypothetical protein